MEAYRLPLTLKQGQSSLSKMWMRSKRTLFTIECETGKDISRHTFSDEHDDILLIPGRQFEVVACLDPGDGLRMIQIKEVTLT
ncbi:unnamed protein product [Rotaria sordida]|uniref:Uncharacterized protein n=1 Tax=Rotaria sordida TaxID=392033 RepID=A0A815FSW6_9BILA|nr:unnamed protein product [Rotaria sordida]